ncbi:MAG: DUF4062 domain-containing protein [Shewanella sp.]|uniref:DUF4062 domain-containing protein n=1 Tax=unclassified Shewanella TaxID=196818 RepID=UPI0021D9B4E0|nr:MULTISPECIES: DUF4062 domain-containing protein [unclassified Shewanella]MCU8033347.1 DUF4062 domain-containing protein [Shewanella sp. SM71]MCU8095270.1 DUF4062 domain-containing protein [Shewanella sp. SM102]
MAIPRVFISSTCYDLKHIRENLKYFVKTVGYMPVLSDDGDVYYSVDAHTHDACISEVATCQLFILIIGGRYGGEHKDKEGSITNNEYREAVKNKIPIFALVENAVYSDHHTYLSNKKSNPDFYEKIAYTSIDNIKIFSFIDEVRKSSTNNALVPFNNFADMEAYLKKQWAGLMYDLLTERVRVDNARITNRLIDDLSIAAKKTEELIKVLVRSTNIDHIEDKISKIDLKAKAESFIGWLYDYFGIAQMAVEIDNIPDIREYDRWFDYLAATEAFCIDLLRHEEGESAFITHRITCQTVEIWETVEGNTHLDNHQGIQEAFEALKQVDDFTRENILKNIFTFFK